MKKILTILLFAVISISSVAQTVWKDTVTFGGFPKDGFVHDLYDTLYNNTSNPITLTWNIASQSLLTGWSGIGICDAATGVIGTCYTFADAVNPQTIVIPANAKGTIDIQMKAISTAADGYSYVNVTSNFGDMVFRFWSWPTAVKDYQNSNLVTLYPNPATDHVNIILNDKRISSINVVNVIGRRIAKFSVDANKMETINVPLDKVADGVYLLQFADLNGKVLGVRRVTKQ